MKLKSILSTVFFFLGVTAISSVCAQNGINGAGQLEVKSLHYNANQQMEFALMPNSRDASFKSCSGGEGNIGHTCYVSFDEDDNHVLMTVFVNEVGNSKNYCGVDLATQNRIDINGAIYSKPYVLDYVCQGTYANDVPKVHGRTFYNWQLTV